MSKIPVVLISDDNFIMPTCVAITSLIVNKKPETEYDIYIIMAECSDESYAKIKELHSTHGMYFGHDHINNYVINYDGIHFGYGIKATDRVYADDSMLGGRVIKLANDHSLSYEDIYHTYAEVK